MRHDLTDERLLEAVEACRPASDDLADPEFAALAAELGKNRKFAVYFARLQKVDAVLAGAIQDVPVPQGFSGRLLAALAAQAITPPMSLPAEPDQAPFVAPAVEKAAAARSRARPWMFSVAGAVAALLLVGVGLLQRAQVDYSSAGVLEAAVDFFNNDSHDQGQLLSAVSPPWGFPASRYVQLPTQTRWRKVGSLLESGGVAYEMGGPGGLRATLYVVRRAVAGLPDQPPTRPVYGTARCCSAAWQEGQLLYVLVVVGEGSDYQRLLNVPQGPLA
jgi:hypothetical protein